MLFIVGWSSIAFASVKSIHSNLGQHEMTHMSMQHTQQHPQNVKSHVQSMCHDTQIEHCKMTLEHGSIQTSCDSCSTVHCQSTFTSLDIHATSALVQLTASPFDAILNFYYLMNSSKGYLQDLLRPPQA